MQILHTQKDINSLVLSVSESLTSISKLTYSWGVQEGFDCSSNHHYCVYLKSLLIKNQIH